MISNFQNEIIAGVLLILLLVVYLLIKSKISKNSGDKIKSSQKELEEIKVPKVEPFNKVIEEEKVPTSDIENSLVGTEEGDFGEDDIVLEEKTIATKDIQKKTIKKRDVPQHDKITKQNFEEFSGERILVAEDNLINQKVLTGLLAGSGIEIIIANDGQEALDILENDDDFLMILMDAHMPRVDGFEATKIIRKNPKYDHILVVALSGDTAPDDIEKMKQAGMSEHLEKPLRMETFYDLLYAYTGESDNDTNSDEYIEIIMTKELNGDKGLEVCGGDEEFYREILLEFEGNYANSYEKLNEFLTNNNINQADKLLLDIIGVSANIGAEQLNKIASDIKDTLSNKEEKNYLTLINLYKVHLEELIKDIQEYLKN